MTFSDEVELAVHLYEKAIGHAATRTREMIKEHGEIGALGRLMDNPDIQKGFKALRDSGQLDKTFEAIITRHKHLFDDSAIAVAKWRLENPNWQD